MWNRANTSVEETVRFYVDPAMEWLTLSRVGLLYDIVGVLILGYGALSSGKTEFSEVNLQWGVDVKTKAIVTAKLDSIVGITLLCIGFICQLLATDPRIVDAFSSRTVYGFIGFAVPFLATAAYLAFRPRLALWFSKSVRANAA